MDNDKREQAVAEPGKRTDALLCKARPDMVFAESKRRFTDLLAARPILTTELVKDADHD